MRWYQIAKDREGVRVLDTPRPEPGPRGVWIASVPSASGIPSLSFHYAAKDGTVVQVEPVTTTEALECWYGPARQAMLQKAAALLS